MVICALLVGISFHWGFWYHVWVQISTTLRKNLERKKVGGVRRRRGEREGMGEEKEGKARGKEGGGGGRSRGRGLGAMKRKRE